MGKKEGRHTGPHHRKKEKKDKKMPAEQYEAELARLHAELVKRQYWVRMTGARIIVVFEGRDAAGKGGVIKRITERVSPRVFRVVALPAPSERERTQMYMQRYVRHFPAAGEIILFDRSWYNRAGVEHVMGFCTEEEYIRFLQAAPFFEQMIVENGIQLIKYWFDVSKQEQARRFEARLNDPRKIWKLSPMDVESYQRWYDYSRARDAMLTATDTRLAPWYVVRADDKQKARLNCISHLLSLIDYEALPRDPVVLGKRDKKGAYDDTLSPKRHRFVPEKF
jgi:polyphosphate kinase 2